MIRFVRNLSLLAVASLAVGSSAQAAVITQVDSYGPSATPFSANLVFNRFNTNLGTLTGITIILSENGTVNATVTNTSTTNTYTYNNNKSTGEVDVYGPGTPSDGSVAPTVSTTITTATVAGSVGPNTTITSATITGSATGSTAATDFVDYSGAGAGTYVINAQGFVSSAGRTSAGTVSFGGNASIGGSVEVDYTYTPNSTVPEPATLGMVVLGLGGVFAARKLRRKSA